MNKSVEVSFYPVESNLRQSFRALARHRPFADVTELPGVTIASLGVKFQMFNAAFLSSPVVSASDLEARLQTMKERFRERGTPWALWVCDDWLERAEIKVLSRECQKVGLRLSSELPGMVLGDLKPSKRLLPLLELREITEPGPLRDFRALGALCFHVPQQWFGEVFDEHMDARQGFRGYTGYINGEPVATAAWVPHENAVGLYNIATAPQHRLHGIAEAMTRACITVARAESGIDRIVLQSTSQGLRLYERLGFRTVTRILVYNSL